MPRTRPVRNSEPHNRTLTWLVTQVLWNKLREKSVDKPEKQKMLDGVIQALQGKVCGAHGIPTCSKQDWRLLALAAAAAALLQLRAWLYSLRHWLPHSIFHLPALALHPSSSLPKCHYATTCPV